MRHHDTHLAIAATCLEARARAANDARTLAAVHVARRALAARRVTSRSIALSILPLLVVIGVAVGNLGGAL